MQRVGLIGCGNISGAYLSNNNVFPSAKIVACADIRKDAAEAQAAKFGIEAVGVDDLLVRKDIDIILNLTTPPVHVEIDLAALEAGKHSYSEKPFALDRESGRKVLELAAKKGRRVGCAPDTFLGGGQQTCRKMVDDGVIGRVVGGTAFMLCHGHEAWHPAPAFYYLRGGGPLFDMGPYYITALVNMLGPVARVAAMSTRSTDLRKGLGVNAGKTFPVEVDTHISATLEFASGAVITLIMSFDVWHCGDFRDIELFGTEGSIHAPDPNCFGGEARFMRQGLNRGWAVADNQFGYTDNMRFIGLADMAAAIERGRPHRCSGELAFHVLDVMCSICDSAREGRAVVLESKCGRPEPLRLGLKHGELD